MANTPKFADNYEIEFAGTAPPYIITRRGLRWQSLRAHLADLWEGTSKHPYLVVRTKTAKDINLARIAVSNWVHQMKLKRGDIMMGTNRDNPNELYIWTPKRATPTTIMA